MKLLKHINNNLFLIDTSISLYQEIEGFYFNSFYKEVVPCSSELDRHNSKGKIIAQLHPELKDTPLFTLPEEQVDNAAENYADTQLLLSEGTAMQYFALVKAYNQALSDNAAKVYTKADLKLAVDIACGRIPIPKGCITNSVENIEKYLKSLSQPNLSEYDGKEVEVEHELITCGICGYACNNYHHHNNWVLEPLLKDGKLQIKFIEK